MRKVPLYLKGLAETRARAHGDVLRLESLKAEIDVRLAEAQKALDACDTLIKKFDERLELTSIKPIRAWKGRYGSRGAFHEAVIRIIKAAAPQEISTTMLALELQAEFGLDFAHPNDRRRWVTNTLGNCLKDLIAAGMIERLHEARPTGEVGRWRWKDSDLSLDHLRAQAAAAGVSVQQADDVHERSPSSTGTRPRCMQGASPA
ncbi:MAG: hypothetical protein QM686_00045 [Herbaspirillum sp.]